MARQVLLTKPISLEHPRIRLQTILYRTERIKGFKYGKVRMHEVDGSASLSVRILPRRNSRPYCSGCGRRGPVHSKLPDRQFQHIPIYGIAVVFLYAMRRVKCDRCGVKVEMVPWGDGKNRMTTGGTHNIWRRIGSTWSDADFSVATAPFGFQLVTVPEPSTIVLGAISLVTIAGIARRRRNFR